MSAALQLPLAAAPSLALCGQAQRLWTRLPRPPSGKVKKIATEPLCSLAFYRRHTEAILRRYLYASMKVGRSPSILSDPIGRGWVSSRPVRTFEDALIFVLDVEKCISELPSLDRDMLVRVILQEYTHTEAAALLGMSVRAIGYKLPQALDHLTAKLMRANLLVFSE